MIKWKRDRKENPEWNDTATAIQEVMRWENEPLTWAVLSDKDQCWDTVKEEEASLCAVVSGFLYVRVPHITRTNRSRMQEHVDCAWIRQMHKPTVCTHTHKHALFDMNIEVLMDADNGSVSHTQTWQWVSTACLKRWGRQWCSKHDYTTNHAVRNS